MEAGPMGGKMRRPRGLSIRKKLQGIILATCVVALLAASTVFALYDRSTFLRAKSEDLTGAAKMIGFNSTAALEFGDKQSARETLSALQASGHVKRACIYDRTGLVFAQYNREADREGPFFPPVGDETVQVTGSKLILFQKIFLDSEFLGTIYIEADLKDLSERMKRFMLIDLGVLLGSLVIAFLMSLRLQRIISTPVQEQAETAASVSARENYSIRATKRSNDEIGLLFDQFNNML